MRSLHRQRGLGLWGWIFTLGMIGFVALVALQTIPLFLAEQKIHKVVKATAMDPSLASAQPDEIRRAMQLRWDVEDITTLRPKDVKIVSTARGKALAYEYSAKAPLFYNISVVVDFKNQFFMGGVGEPG